jgi:hypothetical protein
MLRETEAPASCRLELFSSAGRSVRTFEWLPPNAQLCLAANQRINLSTLVVTMAPGLIFT